MLNLFYCFISVFFSLTPYAVSKIEWNQDELKKERISKKNIVLYKYDYAWNRSMFVTGEVLSSTKLNGDPGYAIVKITYFSAYHGATQTAQITVPYSQLYTAVESFQDIKAGDQVIYKGNSRYGGGTITEVFEGGKVLIYNKNLELSIIIDYKDIQKKTSHDKLKVGKLAHVKYDEVDHVGKIMSLSLAEDAAKNTKMLAEIEFYENYKPNYKVVYADNLSVETKCHLGLCKGDIVKFKNKYEQIENGTVENVFSNGLVRISHQVKHEQRYIWKKTGTKLTSETCVR